MGLFDRFRNTRPSLAGVWTIDPSDTTSLSEFGDVSMEFSDDGRLNYLIKEEGSVQAISMTYVIKGDMLTTDQPSHPNEQVSRFKVDPLNVLTIWFDGTPARFLRV
jgi:hypothetical protein